jgi:hypothetical protein
MDTPNPFHSGGSGDPHFLRWKQARRDSFHGECDLVLVSSPDFHQGQGLDVHLRTTIRDDWYSYIEAAAVRIGDYTLEFDQHHFMLDGVQYTDDSLPLSFGEKEIYKISKVDNKHRVLKIDLNDKSSISVRATSMFMSVTLDGNNDDFATSVGMMGEYSTGDMYGRDGRLIEDMIEYGMEWQVQQNDPKLFVETRAPQWPEAKCRMPTLTAPSRRNLRAQNTVLMQQAKEACANVIDFDLCVDDVLGTGEPGLADSF